MLIAGPAVATRDSNSCGMYPDGVNTGYSGCILREAGEKPLWHRPSRRGVRQQIRLTFTEGHLAYTKLIDFEERADGSGIIRLRTLRRKSDSGSIESSRTIHHVTSAEVATINRLGSASDTWDQPIGSWDGDELFLHCETLDMERRVLDGYSFSSVNISCNQPEKLMPFVTFITGLVGLKPYADRQMF
ncbi:MAG: hypothetical protein ABI240_04750 [Sphingomonas sp.]